MKSRLTLGIAGLLFVGAIIAGYQGVKLSQASKQTPAVSRASAVAEPGSVPLSAQPEPAIVQAPQESRTPVVVLATELAPGVAINEQHLRIEQLRIAPPDTFSSPVPLLGLQVLTPLPAGAILTKHSFDNSGPLARMIGPEERALAIAIDEVVAAGGFIRPGDYVDVLLYLRENQRHEQQTAQVVIPALRVLSVGQQLGLTAQGQPIAFDTDAEPGRGSSRGASTAVLAVPKRLVSRFMLAAEAGKLRLAVRSAEEPLLKNYYAKGQPKEQQQELARQLLKFDALALGHSTPAEVAQPRRAVRHAGPTRSASISVYRGTNVSQQTP